MHGCVYASFKYLKLDWSKVIQVTIDGSIFCFESLLVSGCFPKSNLTVLAGFEALGPVSPS